MNGEVVRSCSTNQPYQPSERFAQASNMISLAAQDRSNAHENIDDVEEHLQRVADVVVGAAAGPLDHGLGVNSNEK